MAVQKLDPGLCACGRNTLMVNPTFTSTTNIIVRKLCKESFYSGQCISGIVISGKAMARAPSTPRSANSDDGNHASWLPRDIPYSSVFEDSVQDILFNPPRINNGIQILPDDALSSPKAGRSIRLRDVPSSSLPEISFSSLPLPLNDSRRIYASPIPGINLTHPGGYLEGGPGISPSEDEFARHFIADNRVRDVDGLQDVVQRDMRENLELARQRMRNREEAKEHNARIEREMKTLSDQMDLETRVLNKAREKAKERRERKERRAKE